jgi:hypothetical protein
MPPEVLTVQPVPLSVTVAVLKSSSNIHFSTDLQTQVLGICDSGNQSPPHNSPSRRWHVGRCPAVPSRARGAARGASTAHKYLGPRPGGPSRVPGQGWGCQWWCQWGFAEKFAAKSMAWQRTHRALCGQAAVRAPPVSGGGGCIPRRVPGGLGRTPADGVWESHLILSCLS